MSIVNFSKKARCGITVSSACIPWEGGYDDIITQESVGCDAAIEDVVLEVSEHVHDLEEQLDLSEFNPGTLNFDPDDDKVKDLLQILADKVQDLQNTVDDLQAQITSIASGNLDVTIDLACLSSEISSCETPPNYSLTSVLQLLINQNC